MSKNQKLVGYTKTKGLDYIKLHLQKYKLLMNTFISPSLSIFQKTKITLDFVGCIIKYGVGINDYFQYNFYRRKACDRSSFIVARNRRKMLVQCNGNIQQPDFDDKSRFNRIFSAYLGRDWLDLKTCTLDDFHSFINKHSSFIVKMKNGSGGNGIYKYTINDLSAIAQEFENLKSQNVLLEEIMVQHAEMAQFNPSCVNTLRIITLVTSQGVKVMNAVFRCGNGNDCTDNFHHFGLAALIDVDLGIVTTPAVDKLNQKFYTHPLSNKQIIGFHIPLWDKILEIVKNAALIRPNIRYVGWDIVILENGNIAIIEGNCAADPDILQMPDQIGKWEYYRKNISF